jgi:hypothetical protein
MKIGITLQPFYFYYSKYKESTLFQFTLLSFSFANNNKEDSYYDWALLDINIDVDYEKNYKFFDCKTIMLFGITIYKKEFQDWN